MEGEGLFCPDWTAQEELKLLESIDEYGYGNWSSVAAQVGRSGEECKSHYVDCYLDSPHPILPVLFAPCEDASEGPPDLAVASGDDSIVPVYYPGTEIEGYMPHRGDFTVEADDDAEEEIADLNFDPNDDNLVTALKLTAVDSYCQRVRQRAYRKRIIREYGLLDIRKQLATDETRLTTRQLRVKRILRPFMRFMNPETAEKFLQSLYVEEHLCMEIRRLQGYRCNGITSLKGSKLYEKLLAMRREQKNEQKAFMKSGFTTEVDMFYRMLHQNGDRNGSKRTREGQRERQVLDISHSIGVEKLTPDEKELCSQCRLQPVAYLQYKQQLVSECRKEGKVRLADARKLIKIDVNKTRRIYNLLVEKGLVVK